MRRTITFALLLFFGGGYGPAISDADAATIAEARLHIRHVVVIMQENRSFDHYFGTFPGADGLPRDERGNFAICMPYNVHDRSKGCVRPFHDRSVRGGGGPHSYYSFVQDRDGGKMDGFVEQEIVSHLPCLRDPDNRLCARHPKFESAMAYHTGEEIPNYWTYARTYMLQDHLFAPVGQNSLGTHLMMVSEWVAHCTDFFNPMSCITTNDPDGARYNTFTKAPLETPFAWTNLTWLLDSHGVPWKYYLSEGGTPDCDDQNDIDICDPEIQKTSIASIWNPLPAFTQFQEDAQANREYVSHVAKLDRFYRDVAANNLPAVAWIIPNGDVSEHPPASVVDGMNYVTTLVNTIMQSPYYHNTVIFIAWDDWGGFYDHVNPPVVDKTVLGQLFGYGFRVPGLVINPFVDHHFDHQILSFDAYNRLIEDLFLNSERLDPATDGRPDPRPDVREALTTGWVEPENIKVGIGDLLNEFDFRRPPIPPIVLSNTVRE